MSSQHKPESAGFVATEIMMWQAVAQQLPLTDVQELACTMMNDLAGALNAFNDTEFGADEDLLAFAVSEIAQQATAAAIFTLGAQQRVQHTAHFS